MSSDYTRKSAVNAVISLATQLSSNLLSFVSRYIFIHFLSEEYLGINGLFSNVLTLLSFAELGIGEALAYAMYKPMKEHDQRKLRALLSFYKIAYWWIMGAVLFIGIAISFFVDGLVSQKPDIPENFQILFCLFLINNAMSYFMVYKQSVLMVDQNRYVVSIVRQATYVGQIIIQSIFLIVTRNYYVYLLWQIAGTIVTNMLLSFYVDKKYPWAKCSGKQDKLSTDEKQSIYRDIKDLSISKIAGVISNGSDNIIIAKLVDLVSVGLISNYTMVINALNGILWGALSSITGSIGQFNVDSDIKEKRKIFDELYLCTFWLYSFLCIGLMTLLSPLVSVWLGSKYTVAQPIVIALVAITYISGLNFPFYTFRVTCGLFAPMKYNYVYYAILNVALSVVLCNRFGVFGVYVATSLSRLVAAEFKEGVIVYKNILQKSMWKYFVKYILYAGLFFGVYLITQSVVNLVTVPGWLGLIAKGALCTVCVNAIYLIVFARTGSFIGLFNKCKRLVWSKIG